jgi:hypothetical protein
LIPGFRRSASIPSPAARLSIEEKTETIHVDPDFNGCR